MHVLMIEDNEDDFLLFKRTVGKMVDLKLEWRDSLVAGLAYIQSNSVDVLIMDMHLPDGDGLEAFERMQSRCPALPIVILSGSSTDSTALEAVRRGAQDYLVKGTFNLEVVEKSLRYAMERKRTQNALAEERTLLRTLVDALPDYIYIKDKSHRTVFSNLSRARSFGLKSPEETIGTDDADFLPKEMAAQFRKDENKLLQTGAPLIEHEERNIGHDGKPIWALTTKLPLRNLSGELIGLVGITRDITERKERERQMRYFASMQENVNDAVVATDMEFRIQSWNHAAERIYGWKHDEVLGRRTASILRTEYESDVEREQVIQSFLKRGSWEGEFVQHHKNGTPIYALVSSNIFTDERGESIGVVSVMHDITERKRAEDALRQALEKEQELNRIKFLVNSMASHEFRQPLATIVAKASSLIDNRSKFDEAKINRSLQSIITQVDHLTSLIDDVMNLADVEAPTSFKPIEMDLDRVCHEIVEEFQEHTDLQHQLLYTCIRKPPPLKLDKRMVRQIINNLVSNALKYSPSGKTVSISLEGMHNMAVLCVRDQGIGIPQDDQKKLFEPFHRAGNVESINGTGLGLLITKRSVERHGGEIAIESQLGQGTMVCVNFPYEALNEKANEVETASVR